MCIPCRFACLATVVAAGTLVLAASPAHAQQGWDQGPPPATSNTKLSGPIDPYTAAMLFKQKGEYSKAMPLLEQLAALGRGYEVAQLELGKGYLDMSKQAPSKEIAEQDRTLSLAWTLKSADAGLALAQVQLVRLYLDGIGIVEDPVEAAKWYVIWQRNPSRMQIGANQFDTNLEERLKTGLNAADWDDARDRASAWKQG